MIISTFVLSTFVSVDYFIFSKQDAAIKQIENKKPNEARVPEIKALDSTLMPNTRIRKDTLKINTKHQDINEQNVNIESKNEQNNYTRENYQNFDNLTDISDSVVKQNEFIIIKDSSGQKSDSSTKTIYIKNDDIIIRDTVIKYEKRKSRKLFDYKH